MEFINPNTGRPFTKDFFKEYARGKPCQIRIATACAYQSCADFETTTLTHITLPGLKAMGKKLVPDLCGAWGCDTCHGLVDGRYSVRSESLLELEEFLPHLIHGWHMDGMARTIAELVKAGYLPNPI